MKIDNAQLAAFDAVLREGSFEAAARRLHVTPSAISQRVRQLEERLGQVLVQRTTPCQPTEAGRALARHAEQLLLLEAELFGEIGLADEGSDPGGRRVRVPLVTNADSLDTWFLPVLDAVAADGSILLDIRVEDQDHSATLLREGLVMAAVSASAQPVQGCSVELLGTMRYRAVASPAYLRRYFADGVDAATLPHAPMLTYNRKDELQKRFLGQFSGDAIQPPIHFVPSVRAFFEASRRGLGWGMMPDQLLTEAMAAGALIEIAPGHGLEVPLYWHRWRFASPTLARVSEYVRIAAVALQR